MQLLSLGSPSPHSVCSIPVLFLMPAFWVDLTPSSPRSRTGPFPWSGLALPCGFPKLEPPLLSSSCLVRPSWGLSPPTAALHTSLRCLTPHHMSSSSLVDFSGYVLSSQRSCILFQGKDWTWGSLLRCDRLSGMDGTRRHSESLLEHCFP